MGQFLWLAPGDPDAVQMNLPIRYDNQAKMEDTVPFVETAEVALCSICRNNPFRNSVINPTGIKA
jgi:hypothetical protein